MGLWQTDGVQMYLKNANIDYLRSLCKNAEF